MLAPMARSAKLLVRRRDMMSCAIAASTRMSPAVVPREVAVPSPDWPLWRASGPISIIQMTTVAETETIAPSSMSRRWARPQPRISVTTPRAKTG